MSGFGSWHANCVLPQRVDVPPPRLVPPQAPVPVVRGPRSSRPRDDVDEELTSCALSDDATSMMGAAITVEGSDDDATVTVESAVADDDATVIGDELMVELVTADNLLVRCSRSQLVDVQDLAA